MKCRGCSAQIDFVRLRSGRLIPVEGEEPERYRVWLDRNEALQAAATHLGEIERRVLVAEGEILTTYIVVQETLAADGSTRRRTIDGPALVEARESHFAHCPKAESFRR